MTTRTRLRPSPEHASPLQQIVSSALEDMKAVNVRVLDVRGLTDIADTMVVASGTSDRHVRSIADNVSQKAKRAGFRPLGTEGARDGEWALAGPGGLMCSCTRMLPRVRESSPGLESLWEGGAPVAAAAAARKPPAKPAAARQAAARRRRVSR